MIISLSHCMHHTNLSRTEFVACFQTNSDLQGRCRALTATASILLYNYQFFFTVLLKQGKKNKD